jgi:ABC-type amino acid transport substrate-binding protein
MFAQSIRFPAPLLSVSVLLAPLPASGAASPTLEKIKARGALLWGSDSEGGAPYVFPDPRDPSKLVGFELDITEAIAKRIGSGRSWCRPPGTASSRHSSGAIMTWP